MRGIKLDTLWHCANWCINYQRFTQKIDAHSPCSKSEHPQRTVKTLTQACPQEYPKSTSAFNGQLIHGILQFTMVIALRCALHHHVNLDICCWNCSCRISSIKHYNGYSLQLSHTNAQQSVEHCRKSMPRPTIILTAWPHEWSFRRFTYGNLVTTSPSSKW